MKRKLLLIVLCVLFSSNLFAQNKIIEYEFWLNDNYQNKVTKSVTPSVQLEINTDLDLPAVNIGFNKFSIRFKDSNGKYSSTFTKFFFYGGKSEDDTNSITTIEYWIDNDFAKRKQISVSDGNDISETLDVASLSDGFHRINIRFKDVSGLWSSVKSQYFFKAGEGNSEENLVTRYRYWTDENFQTAKYVYLQKPVKLAELQAVFEIEEGVTESVHIQFQDTAGLWSSVFSKKFIPEADFEVFNTINTFSFQNRTVFGKTYLWKFGDGKTSTAVNPTYTYAQPGVYDVCLIAENKLGKDTICKPVTVIGLREVISNKAGNTGDGTFFVYGGGFTDKTIVYLQDAQGNKITPTRTFLYKLDALSVTFDFRGAKEGVYSVVAEIDGKKYTLENSFTIEKGTKPEPFVNISGRDRILFGRWQTYTLNFGNKGNVDATGVPLILVFSEPTGFDVEFPELVLNQNTQLKSDKNYNDFKDLPNYFKIDNLFGEAFNGRVYALYIPVIPANSNQSMKILVRTNQNIQIYAWMTEPYFMSPIDKKIEDCIRIGMLKAIKDGLVDIGLNNMPVVGCIYNFWNQYLESSMWEYMTPDADPSQKSREKSWKETIFSWGNSALDLTVLIFNCAKDFVAPLKAYSVAIQVAVLINNIKGNYLFERECREKYKPLSQENKNIRAVASFDPNEIVGPTGFADGNYTLNNIAYPYTIYFENLKTASAPAQEVVIIDTLESEKYDFSTFSFGKVTWGNKEITPLPGLKEFTLDYSLKPENPNILRINAKFDEQTGIVYWQFITLDTNTMNLTEDPEGGFLPPNKNAPEGEGSVQFSVLLKPNLPHNDEIRNKAKIFFDLNEPIITNTYSNKIDIVTPHSQLYEIAYTPKPNVYRIKSKGNDDGSGIRHKRIYASINGGDYFPLLTTNEDVLYIELEPDSTYYFFSQAVDSVGNLEPVKTNYEISTLNVGIHNSDAVFDDFNLFPNPAKDFVDLEFNLEKENTVQISIYDLTGKLVLFKNIGFVDSGHNERLDISELPAGNYFIRAKFSNTSIIKKLTIKR